MTPKEKANELIEKYADSLPSIFYNVVEAKNYHSAKRCALIAVNENLEYEKMLVEQIKNHVEIFKEMKFKTQNLFWESVKEELQKL